MLRAMTEFILKDCRVRYTRDDQGQRVWHCGCADFDARRMKYGEGFCPHVVLAVEALIERSRLRVRGHAVRRDPPGGRGRHSSARPD